MGKWSYSNFVCWNSAKIPNQISILSFSGLLTHIFLELVFWGESQGFQKIQEKLTKTYQILKIRVRVGIFAKFHSTRMIAQ